MANVNAKREAAIDAARAARDLNVPKIRIAEGISELVLRREDQETPLFFVGVSEPTVADRLVASVPGGASEDDVQSRVTYLRRDARVGIFLDAPLADSGTAPIQRLEDCDAAVLLRHPESKDIPKLTNLHQGVNLGGVLELLKQDQDDLRSLIPTEKVIGFIGISGDRF